MPLLKPDGSVRVCGDYKVTIDHVLEVSEHPMPTANDTYHPVTGGEKVTKLDLSSAYQQVLLEEESRQYVTINTHLGLFRYTRLPFGIASSPAIFQKILDSIMKGLVVSRMISISLVLMMRLIFVTWKGLWSV